MAPAVFTTYREFLEYDPIHPHIADDPQQWEAAWAKDLQQSWGPTGIYGSHTSNFSSYISDNVAEVCASEEALLELQYVSRQLRLTQLELGKLASLHVVRDNLDDKWRNMEDAKKRATVLEALQRAMFLPGSHEERRLCPDSTVDYLVSAGGETFLGYMICLLPNELDHTSDERQPHHVPHREVDRYLRVDPLAAERRGYQAFAEIQRLKRTSCLTRIVIEVIIILVCPTSSP